LGRSIVLDLRQDAESKVVYPNVLKIGGESFEATVAEVDLEIAKIHRALRLSERRPSVYSLLSER
jgi:hypothetical protein